MSNIASSSICLNASGTGFAPVGATGFYMTPMRGTTGPSAGILSQVGNAILTYNTGTYELVWTPFIAPVKTVLTGSGTTGNYTTPLNTLYVRVRMVGGGAGGVAASTVGGTAYPATGGGNTTLTLGANVFTAFGGNPGGPNTTGNTNSFFGGTGGTTTIPTGCLTATTMQGGAGQGGEVSLDNSQYMRGGAGGNSMFGGGGNYGPGSPFVYTGFVGAPAAANSGSGGQGGGIQGNSSNNNPTASGPGGGAGGFIDAIIANNTVPVLIPTMSYLIGTFGTYGGNGGAGSGGIGAAGLIELTAYFQ